jgi:alpha-1,2-glucosyltransferase
VPSLLSVVITIVAASQGRHWTANMVRDVCISGESHQAEPHTQLGIISCTFRQTNIIWLLYAYASSQLMHLRFRRAPPGGPTPAKLHDPPALAAGLRSSAIYSISRNDGLTG